MLEIAKIVELAKEHATPMYLFDLDELQSRVQAMKEILGEDIRLCYAMKANPFLVDSMSRQFTSLKSAHLENLQSVKESRSQWLILCFRVSIKKKQIFFM